MSQSATQQTEHAELATELMALREERDQLTTTIATKQAVLFDLEQRTTTLSARRDEVVWSAQAAEERLASLQDQLAQVLRALPALRTDLATVVRTAIDDAMGARLERAVQACLRKQLGPALKAAQTQVSQEAKKP